MKRLLYLSLCLNTCYAFAQDPFVPKVALAQLDSLEKILWSSMRQVDLFEGITGEDYLYRSIYIFFYLLDTAVLIIDTLVLTCPLALSLHLERTKFTQLPGEMAVLAHFYFKNILF